MKKIIYQVLPRLFGNTTQLPIANGSLLENGSGKFNSFTPEVLASIKELGATSVWYTGVIEHATQEDFTALGIPLDPKPTIKGRAGSPYAIKDYYDVNPYLATVPAKRMEEFEELVKRTHKAGLEVIIDFVPNHVARCYRSDAAPKGVVDFGANDRTDFHFHNQNNFYYFPGQALQGCFTDTDYNEFPAKATGNDCFYAHPSTYDWYETIKLNYGVDYCAGGRKDFDPMPDTWTKMVDILLFWAGKGIDAFRCDMAEMVPVAFWSYAIAQVKTKYPKVQFIAEVYNPQLYWTYVKDGGFDYLYDKVGLYDTLRAVTCGYQHASAITRCWQQVEGLNEHMLNFLENHDEQRIASDFFARNPRKAFPALVVSALMNTVPFMLYAGQELGESGMEAEGFSGVDGRTTIFDFWAVDKLRRFYQGVSGQSSPEAGEEELCQQLTLEEKSLRDYYRTVLNLANKEKAISKGVFHDLMYVNYRHEGFSSQWNYTFLRKEGKEMILVVTNFFPYKREVKVNLPLFIMEQLEIPVKKRATYTDLLTGTKYTLPLDGEQLLAFEMEGYSALVLKVRV